MRRKNTSRSTDSLSQIIDGVLRTLSVGLLLGALSSAVNAQQNIATSHLRPSHKTIVEKWLIGKASLRLATLADCLNKEGLAATREQFGKNHHPYYIVGDFNRDKRQDFAVVLVNKRKIKDNFAVAIFNGPLNKQGVPAFFEEGWDLSDGGLLESGGGVMAGPFESDNCVILRPRGKKYVIKNCI